MIHYDLQCAQDHRFDGWFRDSGAFEAQSARGLLECPSCGSVQVTRALMSPAVRRKGTSREVAVSAPQETAPADAKPPATVPASVPAENTPTAIAEGHVPAQLRAMLQKMRAEVERRCDYVGDTFADEARRIHRGEIEARGIYGETTPEQAEELRDEGIGVASIPWVPRSDG